MVHASWSRRGALATLVALTSVLGAGADEGDRWKPPRVSRGHLELEAIGRIQLDLAGGGVPSTLGPGGHFVEPRRARLGIAGGYGPDLGFKLEYDWAGGDTEIKDAFLTWDDGPGILVVGHQKEAFGFEQLQSTKHTTFVERAAVDALNPARNLGVSYRHVLGAHGMIEGGLFRDADPDGEATQPRGTAATVRAGGLPWHPAPDRLLWLGAAFSRRRPPGDALRVRTRLESPATGRPLDTGALAVTDSHDRALELAFQRGPLSLQAEGIRKDLSSPTLGDAHLQGWYVAVSWFPTGDHKRFDLRDGVFEEVVPRRPWDGRRGGAVELALRFSNLDLNDGPVRGGELDAWSFAANWTLHERSRLQLSVSRPDVDGRGGAELVTLRYSYHF